MDYFEMLPEMFDKECLDKNLSQFDKNDLFNGLIGCLIRIQDKHKLQVFPDCLGLLDGTRGYTSLPDYVKLGSLFAQNLITEEYGMPFYNGVEQESQREMGRGIENEFNFDFDTQPFIQQTLSRKLGSKCFYTRKELIDNTLSFCVLNSIEVHPEYMRKVRQKLKDNNIFDEL
jgi:hypothetical protein